MELKKCFIVREKLCQYCNDAGRYFCLYLLRKWIDLDKSWLVDGRSGKNNCMELSAETVLNLSWIHYFGHLLIITKFGTNTYVSFGIICTENVSQTGHFSSKTAIMYRPSRDAIAHGMPFGRSDSFYLVKIHTNGPFLTFWDCTTFCDLFTL